MNATQLSTAEATLTRAIRARRAVAARYAASGDDGIRVIYPHLLYRSAAGELIVEVFQVDGPTRGGRLPGWRVLKVAGLSDIEVLDAIFLPVARADIVSAAYRQEILARCDGPVFPEP